MAEPLSIFASCASIGKAIVNVTKSATNFFGRVRRAENDLKYFKEGLDSLGLVLDRVSDIDFKVGFDNVPEYKGDVEQLVKSCECTVKEMEKAMKGMTKTTWVNTGKEQISELQNILEAHKSSLSLVLQAITM